MHARLFGTLEYVRKKCHPARLFTKKINKRVRTIFFYPIFTSALAYITDNLCTLVCRIDVHARLLILRKKIPSARSYLGLHVYCFWQKFPPPRLFYLARLMFFIFNEYVHNMYLIYLHILRSAFEYYVFFSEKGTKGTYLIIILL